MKQSPRNAIGIFLILISLLCLYPGLTHHILSIKINGTFPIVGEIKLYSSTRSIIGTIQDLFLNNNNLVAFLILLFSVIIPILKAIILLFILFFKQFKYRSQLHQGVSIISKWSMADVFVVAIFLSFLAVQSNKDIHAYLHDGFYYFLTYCMLSILASVVIKIEDV